MRTKIWSMYLLIIFLVILVHPAWAEEDTGNDIIKINEQVIMLNIHNDELQVKELYQITNSGSSEYLEGFKALLPQGANNIYINKREETIEDIAKDSYVISDNEVIFKEPIAAGDDRVYLVYYNIKLDKNNNIFTREVIYPTDTIYVLVPEAKLAINSEELHTMGTQEVGDIIYELYAEHDLTSKATYSYAVDKLAVGEKVTIGYSDNIGFHSASHLESWSSSPLKNTDPHLWLIFIVALIIGLIILISLFIRQKNQAKAAIEKVAREENIYKNLVNKQKRLLTKIKELDKQYETGQLEDDVYKELRQQYKQILIKVKVRIKQFEEKS